MMGERGPGGVSWISEGLRVCGGGVGVEEVGRL